MKSFAGNLRHENAKDRQPALVSVGIGGASKIIASTLTYPYQVVKSRLQQRDLHYNTPRYNGTWDCIVKIWRQDRILGFFRGVVPNALKVAPSSAITFLVYEECLHYLKQT
jgi:solute carrier family 25 folate transporter 32